MLVISSSSGFDLSQSFYKGMIRSCTQLGAKSVIEGRELGSYERLLSRQVPGTNIQAIAHASVAIFADSLSEQQLLEGLSYTVAKHAMLRVCLKPDINAKVYLTSRPRWQLLSSSPMDIAEQCLTTQTVSDEELSLSWQQRYHSELNAASFNINGPRWKVHAFLSPKRTAMLFSVDHGIDDQQSVHIILQDLLAVFNARSDSNVQSLPLPVSLENAVGKGLPSLRTLCWALFQLCNSLLRPSVLPRALLKRKQSVKKLDKTYTDPNQRRTLCRFFVLDAQQVNRLKVLAKTKSSPITGQTLTLTHILSASVLCATQTLLNQGSSGPPSADNLRFLLSVGLRSYAPHLDPKDFTGRTVACASGAIDFLVPMLPSSFINDDGEALSESFKEALWATAKRCAAQAEQLLNNSGYAAESVRLFDIGMRAVDILQAVELDAADTRGLGRGYSCGVSNVGLASLGVAGDGIKLGQVFYGTSHARNGVLMQLSCLTLSSSGELCGCLQFPAPIVSGKDADLAHRLVQHILSSIE